MHYTISDSIIIKSENSALTASQPNKWVINYIMKIKNIKTALDFGCGKMRHTNYLYSKCLQLDVIDSAVQMNRVQIINGERTSIVEYINKNLSNANSFTIEDQRSLNKKYDFILCTNVLSAIPSYLVRNEVLDFIKNHLEPSGKALISVQYRNSYFSTYANNSNATPYLDGWIIRRGRSNTFYGIIKPDALVKQCINVGLNITNKTLSDGSIYLEVNIES